MPNDTILGLDLNQGRDFLVGFSQSISVKLSEYASSLGVVVSDRWIGLLMLFISATIIFVGMKMTKPIIKYIMIILGIILFLGLLIPSW